MTIQGERIREVIVKGEEYFDGRKINYVQTPTKEEPFWVIALTNGALIVTTVPTYVAVKAPKNEKDKKGGEKSVLANSHHTHHTHTCTALGETNVD